MAANPFSSVTTKHNFVNPCCVFIIMTLLFIFVVLLFSSHLLLWFLLLCGVRCMFDFVSAFSLWFVLLPEWCVFIVVFLLVLFYLLVVSCEASDFHISGVCVSCLRVCCVSYTADFSHHTVSNMCTMLYFRFDISLFKVFAALFLSCIVRVCVCLWNVYGWVFGFYDFWFCV